MEWQQQIKTELVNLYGMSSGAAAAERLFALVARHRTKNGARRPFSERDVILISYGDALQAEGRKPLSVLKDFADRYLKECFSAIHLLPFFPFSSDDGFSVTDFRSVNPFLGDWDDIKRLGDGFDLMFDFVLNHISVGSDWFHSYLTTESGYEDLAIEVPPGTDLNSVVRPRTLPLLTPFVKANGQKVCVWTTFSPDQADLNYASIDVLLRMVDVLLAYVQRGARLLRLDAVAYLWKEIGTSCIHLPQTHALIRVLRCILDQVAPEVLIVTETNVPHVENISYFGNGHNEAQIVYNFTLPPLLLHAMLTADSSTLNAWAGTLRPPSTGTAFLNFTASHDGVGVRPLEGILAKAQVDHLIQAAIERGGQVAYGQDKAGHTVPYELNVTYVDAVGDAQGNNDQTNARRFLASQAIALALPGVPGIYLYSLLGSRNWREGVRSTGRARTINRQPLSMPRINAALAQEQHFRSIVFRGCCQLLKIRRLQPAFHPHAESAILELHRHIFALQRTCPRQTLYAITNLSRHIRVLDLSVHATPSILQDVLSRQLFANHAVTLNPYETLWLTAPETAFTTVIP